MDQLDTVAICILSNSICDRVSTLIFGFGNLGLFKSENVSLNQTIWLMCFTNQSTLTNMSLRAGRHALAPRRHHN